MEKQGGDKPESDVAAVDYDAILTQARFTDKAYLLAEVVSSTDEDLSPIRGERWIDVKVRLYRPPTPCRAIIVAEQERASVMVHARDVREGWIVRTFRGFDDTLAIPSVGLSCRVGDLHRDTRWPPRTIRNPRS